MISSVEELKFSSDPDDWKNKTEGLGTVCVDLNGVLDMYAGWEGEVKQYPIRPGALEFLKELKIRGYNVIIHTAVPESGEKFVLDNQLQDVVDYVTSVKLPALFYIDDRAIRFDGDFWQVLMEMDYFRPHWKRSE